MTTKLPPTAWIAERYEAACAFLDIFVPLMEINRTRALRIGMKEPSIDQVIMAATVATACFQGAPIKVSTCARYLHQPRTTIRRWAEYYKGGGLLREDEDGHLIWVAPSVFINTDPPHCLPRMLDGIKRLAGLRSGSVLEKQFPVFTPRGYSMVIVGLYVRSQELFEKHHELLNNVNPDFEGLMIGYVIAVLTYQGQAAKKKSLARILAMPRTNVIRKVNRLKLGGVIIEDRDGCLYWKPTKSHVLATALIAAYHEVVADVVDQMRAGCCPACQQLRIA